MFFYLRFRSQLRRVRPELIPHLEDTVIRAIKSAGGTVTGERRLIKATFNEDTLGFWLDMLLLIEALTKTMEEAASRLYGYSLLLGRDLFDSSSVQMPESHCRFLAGARQRGGIFLDQTAAAGLQPYAVIEDSKTWTAEPEEGARPIDYYRLSELKIVVPAAKTGFPLQEITGQTLRRGLYRTALIAAPLAGKRNALYRYCTELSNGLPPLIIRFGSGGLNALVDAWTTEIQSLAGTGGAEEAAVTEEISRLWTLLFRERLRDEAPPYTARMARRFFSLLPQWYNSFARRKGVTPVIILENIHLAEKLAAEIVIETYTGIPRRQDYIVLGTCEDNSSAGDLQKWEPVFPRVIRFNAGDPPAPAPPETPAPLPAELREIAFTLSLLGRYFPPAFFPRLFEEAGKNPAMISRAVSMLSSLGVIDNTGDPRPWMPGTAACPESIKEAKKERGKALVRGRLLDWVKRQKISPCFRLLLIIAELGSAANLDDNLILESILSDLTNGTFAGMEQARKSGILEQIAGTERAAALNFIINTTKALHSGQTDAISAAFAGSPPLPAASPALEACILVNISGHHLGLRDYDAAQNTIKEAIHLSGGKNNLCLARAYRLFSLVCLNRQRTGEAIDYLGFAMDIAEKSGDYHEQGISTYYAAAIQFLYGNLSGALQLTRKARGCALTAGCPGWAVRAYFFEGRIAFELGHYDAALEIFQRLRHEVLDKTPPGMEDLLAAWIYRSNVYLGNPRSPKPPNGGPDADLFEIEAAYLAGDYQKAAESAEQMPGSSTQTNYLHIEEPGWHSGFAQCEHLYFAQGEIPARITAAYHSLSACRLSAGRDQEAIRNIQQLLREEHISELDPSSVFYFYASYLVQAQSGAGRVDMNTAVSIAYKQLQRRASRIQDVEIRRQFLAQPYWNSALSAAAKEFKLI